MKARLTLAALIGFAPLGAVVPAMAAGGHDAHGAAHDAGMHMEAARQAEGTVRKIDTAAGKVTLKHGPLAQLGMPPMTMTFAADAALLDKLKVGDKVRFVAEEVNGVLTVTELEVLP